MRPSIEIDSGLLAPPSERSGTGRHTLPGTPVALRDRISLGGMADEFFSAGDDGTYEGADPEPLEGVEIEPVRIVVRTPEMDARRARGIRVVAGIVGCFAALLAFGVVRAKAPDEAAMTGSEIGVRQPTESARAAASFRTAAAPGNQSPRALAPAAAPVSRAAPAKTAAPAKERAAFDTQPTVRAAAPRPAVQSIAAKPPATTPPSVANFAARAGDAPIPAGRIPTASFAPAR